MHHYYVYILRCADGSYYTGVTNNIERRFKEHETGRNETCYTFKRRPLSLVYTRHFQYILDAIAFEKQVKGWSRKKKEALINGDFEKLSLLSRNYTQYGKP